jgi:hypothetical protein
LYLNLLLSVVISRKYQGSGNSSGSARIGLSLYAPLVGAYSNSVGIVGALYKIYVDTFFAVSIAVSDRASDFLYSGIVEIFYRYDQVG